jgi:hypothetical protein
VSLGGFYEKIAEGKQRSGEFRISKNANAEGILGLC